MEFDSDELGIFYLDWEDVELLRSGPSYSVRIIGRQELRGRIFIDKDELLVSDEEGMNWRRHDRLALVSIAQDASNERDRWSGKLGLGFNFRSGNSDRIEYDAYADVRRRTAANRLLMNYLGSITNTNNQETENNHRLSGSFDIFVSTEYFFTPVFYEYFRDPFQNISSKHTIGFGGGMHLIDTSKTEWDISGGLGYQRSDFVSVAADESAYVSTPALILSTTYDTELTRWIDFKTSYRNQIVNRKSGRYTHHWISSLEFELTDVWDLDFSLVWDRIDNPQTAEGGARPKKDDFQMIVSVGFEL